jgi:hypothetical protein
MRANLTEHIQVHLETEAMSNIDFLKDKFFYKDKALNKLEHELFEVLTTVSDYLSDSKKYFQLAKFLIRRFTIWKPTPSFPIYLYDIPVEIKRRLMQFADREINDLMNDVIVKIFHYSLHDEEYFNYNYFVKEVQEPGLLKWRLM